jgi:hypothetical protein
MASCLVAPRRASKAAFRPRRTHLLDAEFGQHWWTGGEPRHCTPAVGDHRADPPHDSANTILTANTSSLGRRRAAAMVKATRFRNYTPKERP